MISIREVAKLAGVSPATVSRVMNGTARVDEEKRARVERVICETGFRPNEVARSLFKRSSRTIGMVIPNIENPFINELAKAVEGEAYRHGYRLMLFNSDESRDKEIESIRMLEGMNADGVILMTNHDDHQKELTDFQIPVIMIDRRIDYGQGISWIQSNHYQGGKLAAEHLVAAGCRTIVHMRGPQKYSSARERYEGYLSVCKKYGMEPRFIECEYSFEDGLKQSEELIKQFPDVDGVLAANDIVAISLYKILIREGYRVPEDIQIVGFDNVNLSWLVTPELTTVAQPIKEMGEAAAGMIIQNAEGKEIPREKVFDVALIERDTTKNKKNADN